MRSLRFVPALIVIAAMLAACTAAATPNPDGGDGKGGNPTASTGGDGKGSGTGGDGKGTGTGGGDGKGSGTGGDGKGSGNQPAGWDRFGKVSYAISGGLSASGELGLVPAASQFGGPTHTSLSYKNEGSETIAIIRLGLSGGPTGMIFQFGDSQITVPAAECTTTNLNVSSTSASGNYQCAAGMGMNANGGMFMNVAVSGSFTASAN